MSALRSPPFFPEQWENDSDANATSPDGQLVPPGSQVYMRGITLRDHFASQALVGFIVNGATLRDVSADRIAQFAYEQADAMLKARLA